jgi:sulfate adenylyltransferase subunit 1 (EFTu-like GTPase family)
MEREELLELVTGEIKHNISPVIGWLRMDAKNGRVDDDKDRLNEYRSRVAKAAESIVALLLDEKDKEAEDGQGN